MIRTRRGASTARRSAVALAAAIAVPVSFMVPVTAAAATTTAVNIVGTSDVSDSNLIQAVIAPGFAAAYPQYTLNYIPKGTGAAITYAESGAADGLIVHAESLENQFVDPGAGMPSFSNEPAGRAIFYGDFVLLGPPRDPAHVATNDRHNIVGAFRAIAMAGAAGKADFISRGGTPGTTVEEHQIWQYLAGSSDSPTLCQVGTDNGGGYSPSTAPGACPSSISYPSWYHATGLTQGPNVEAGDVCNFTSGANDCYVLTDRGTFDYLESTKALTAMRIVSRDNSASAPGGATLLTNYFHAYAINPAAVPASSDIDVAGAEAFLNYLTSHAAQSAVSAYLTAGHIDTPPFKGDAAPIITSSSPKTRSLRSGTRYTVHGMLINVAPATPELAAKEVKLVAVHGASTTTLRRVKTDAKGHFTITFKAQTSGTYRIETGRIKQVEDASLRPTFSDLLAPSSLSLGHFTVRAHPSR